MSSDDLDQHFTCTWCGATAPAPDGGRRGHCPSCLRVRHAGCGAWAVPISVAVPRTGDWALVHRCADCGELSSSPVRSDDNQLLLVRLAVRPLAEPPFPLDAFSAFGAL